MLCQLHRRVEGANRLNTSELVVVIFVAGFLGWSSIAWFVHAGGRASDSSAISLAHRAQMDEETYARADGGVYTASPGALQAIDPALADTSAAVLSAPSASGSAGYAVTAIAVGTGDRFTIVDRNGSQRHLCFVQARSADQRACSGGSW
jgi:hypothetical protein